MPMTGNGVGAAGSSLHAAVASAAAASAAASVRVRIIVTIPQEMDEWALNDNRRVYESCRTRHDHVTSAVRGPGLWLPCHAALNDATQPVFLADHNTLHDAHGRIQHVLRVD